MHSHTSLCTANSYAEVTTIEIESVPVLTVVFTLRDINCGVPIGPRVIPVYYCDNADGTMNSGEPTVLMLVAFNGRLEFQPGQNGRVAACLDDGMIVSDEFTV